MSDSDWNAGWARSFMAYLDGTRDADRDDRGRPILDDDLLLVVNGWWEPLTFTLPDLGTPRAWQREVDTFKAETVAASGAGGAKLAAGATLVVEPRSLVLLRSTRSGRRPRSTVGGRRRNPSATGGQTPRLDCRIPATP
jgi:glycogen operon protein